MDKFFEENIKKFNEEVNVAQSYLNVIDYFNYCYKEVKRLGLMPTIFQNAKSLGREWDIYIPAEYTKHSKSKSGYTFITGENESTEPDVICEENSYFDSENKSSATTNIPNGSSTHCNYGKMCTKHKTDDYGFLTFISYDFEYKTSDKLLSPNFIAVGMVKPTDWKKTSNICSGAVIPVDTFIKQFAIVYKNQKKSIRFNSPRLKLSNLNFKKGDIIKLCNCDIDFTVYDPNDNILIYNDNDGELKILTLKEATSIFGKRWYCNDMKKVWSYNNKSLKEIDKEVYQITYLNAA